MVEIEEEGDDIPDLRQRLEAYRLGDSSPDKSAGEFSFTLASRYNKMHSIC